ncbi:hypothetical protein HQ351_19600 [Rhodococcus sp. BP-258]|uniref:hypothetical protein n=1 Tax=unclassified Rhodococcus (in: high G+C Gram-positive bacteria) TaxID=192944 RepID=UPI001C9AEC41|nr:MULTISPECIES: hypothetical protein [unclassified Rhodococcus (in: high G+C Gram-positive bacteria)]MBY6422914.1 hypothetical protein [Rhodococcus sp. BP-324]MBY6471772.1 hypothetical protein [Rhodococcus sp. BP-313]MBY6511401.1 hypothetical protein [Rhodococcus sp. BP-147]MBY6516058.1 hypothetical protein [Rhodococcus sp. BP-254]MBY6535985.1 hypothetical protein [Rhodococcus sp. BP-148]MBY6554264.1 hypothetical protein [Rhodococcus sp. BP-251]
MNYDLNRTGQNYEKLIAYLKSHDSWAKPLASSFFIKTNLTVAELRDAIKQHVDANDSVVVVNVDGQGWGTYGVDKKVSDWMHASI